MRCCEPASTNAVTRTVQTRVSVFPHSPSGEKRARKDPSGLITPAGLFPISSPITASAESAVSAVDTVSAVLALDAGSGLDAGPLFHLLLIVDFSPT